MTRRRPEPVDNPRAQNKVRAALVLIEEAQRMLAAACCELSPVTGGAIVDWRRVSALHNKVKAEWYRVKHRLDKNGHRYGMDSANASGPRSSS